MLRYDLLTEYAENMDKNRILKDYPRPQLKRNSYINLNGIWDYCNSESIPNSFSESITVPFPVESCLSGINRHDRNMVYHRSFYVPEGFIHELTLLHIDASDCLTEVYVNGVHCKSHEGGYLPFTADISGCIRNGENDITVCVKDELSYDYPTGKQREKRGGIWYTTVSGIWQSVWLESVNRGYIKNIRITPDIDRGMVVIDIDSDCDSFDITVYDGADLLLRDSNQGRHIKERIEHAKLWSPEHPHIYTFKLESEVDCVYSYFAMRKFETDERCFKLNNRPYYINGLLDQGYFSDGIYTPASFTAYRDDVLRMKALGFNALRKHIKIEPYMFYYYCDTLGMLVLQDMVNVGKYSFFKDSVLPFAGFRRKLPYVSVSDKQKSVFREHAIATLRHLYNCPCVVYYTVFNEGWGQFEADALYCELKSLDPTRVYDTASGWFYECPSDVVSEHVYFKPIKLSRNSKTVIVSEFGGYSYIYADHVFNTDENFGYRKFKDIYSFEASFIKLYEDEIIGNISNGLAGSIYTQLSDVEDETNGILTYDRRICKLRSTGVPVLMQRLYDEFDKNFN